ncbi:hypothetical protein GCM10007853_17400 [Algimonas ampicilliniresistens]|uniref:DUF736 domain-containing protein n=2 Tax=Algimonas ampicilliniresistens TaxID=1298735 RepID=A0ABQ5V8J3_9PROT|nr:hypothetical protein GCM10007853_17400 [Algimonas ampicilliniresistens]
MTMANALGYITETDTGFEGTLSMLSLSTPIRIVANGLKQDGTDQPDYRVLAGGQGAPIGAGWVRTAKSSGREYVSLTLASPEIGPRKVYANIAPVKNDETRHVILWNPAG